jgi:hypothetical protein
VQSCRLNLRRFGAEFTANSGRAYFLGHEREGVVEHREEFINYFAQREDHFYTSRYSAIP